MNLFAYITEVEGELNVELFKTVGAANRRAVAEILEGAEVNKGSEEWEKNINRMPSAVYEDYAHKLDGSGFSGVVKQVKAP